MIGLWLTLGDGWAAVFSRYRFMPVQILPVHRCGADAAIQLPRARRHSGQPGRCADPCWTCGPCGGPVAW